MNKRVISYIRLVLFAVIIVSLVVLLVLNLKAGLETMTQKFFIGFFILMIIWGLIRIVSIVRDLLR